MTTVAAPSYRQSTKLPQVEELIDLYVHRPIAYLVARACYATPVTPNQITFGSGVLGVLSGIAFALADRPALLVGALLLFASTVLDCADGQLARLKHSSSPWGRIYDGFTDNVVGLSSFLGAVTCMLRMHGLSGWIVLYAIVGLVSGTFHTMIYDYYKHAFVRFAQPEKFEYEDVAEVQARYDQLVRDGETWFRRLCASLHLDHVRTQTRVVRRLDPAARFTPIEFGAVTDRGYVGANAGLVRAWSFFGPGWHFFLTSLAAAAGEFLWYLHYRVVLMNVVLLVLIPLQRRATRTSLG